MTRLVLALAVAGAALAGPAQATEPVCVFVPNGDGGPAYVCTDPATEDCLLYGWLGAENGLGPNHCEHPTWSAS